MERRLFGSYCYRWGGVLCLMLFLMLSFAVPFCLAKTAVQMVSASMGGNSYFWCAAASKVVNEELKDYDISVRAGTTSANILQLEKGEISLAYASPLIYTKMRGKDAMKTTRLREVWVMFPQPWYLIVPKNSPAQNIYDLKGKRIACGIRTGEGSTFLDYIHALGLSEKDFNLFFIGKGEGIEALKNGSVDAFSGGSTVPSPDFTELAASRHGARLIEFSEGDLEKIVSNLRPFRTIGVIPSGSHADIKKDVRTIVFWNALCARDDAPLEMVYNIVKILHKRHKDLVEALPAARFSTAEDTYKEHVFPLHAGTEKFLKEIHIGK